MSGLRALIGLAALLLVLPVQAQTEQKWVPVPTPQGVDKQSIRTAVVTANDEIILFSTARRIVNGGGAYEPGQSHVSADFGETWESFPIPFKAYSLKALMFKEQIFLICDEGIISSYDGKVWAMTLPVPEVENTSSYFFTMSGNATVLMAFSSVGKYYRTEDGLSWSEMSIPGAPRDFLSCAADQDTFRAFAVDFNPDGNQRHYSLSIISSDNGETWMAQEWLQMTAYDADAYNGQYCVVGPRSSENNSMISSRGSLNFDYPGGTIHSVHYFAGHWYMGGDGNGVNDGYSPRGFIMCDGKIGEEQSTGTLAITQITSNRNSLAVALSFGGEVFILKNSFASGITQLNLDESMTIYPNPTGGFVKIIFTGSREDGFVELRNAQGAIISRQEILNQEASIDLSSQPAGVYFINGNRIVKK